MLAVAWDQNAFSFTSSPAGALYEETALRWLAELLGVPGDCGAALVTGATLANVTALAAARHALLARTGWDVEANGLFGAPRAPRLRRRRGARLRAQGARPDRHGPRSRPRACPPTRRAASAAPRSRRSRRPPSCVRRPATSTRARPTTSSPCATGATAAGAWLHVDGAFGLFAAATPRLRAQVEGVERADSWATDCHKWLNVPYDCGAAFVRDASALRGAMAMDASYLPAQPVREPFLHSPELSRRARGIEVWAALRSLGRSGVADLVERCCRHAARFAEGLRAAGHEVFNDVVLNQVVVAFGDAARCAAVIARVQEAGVCWCGPDAVARARRDAHQRLGLVDARRGRRARAGVDPALLGGGMSTPRRVLLATGIPLRYPLATAPIAQLDRAPGFEPGGRGFESLSARQIVSMRPRVGLEPLSAVSNLGGL